MKDGLVIQFRRKATPVVWSDGRMQSECDEHVHLFESIPGRCQCGERLWEVQPATEEAGELKEAREASDSR